MVLIRPYSLRHNGTGYCDVFLKPLISAGGCFFLGDPKDPSVFLYYGEVRSPFGLHGPNWTSVTLSFLFAERFLFTHVSLDIFQLDSFTTEPISITFDLITFWPRISGSEPASSGTVLEGWCLSPS